jgi:hypothetical protein
LAQGEQNIKGTYGAGAPASSIVPSGGVNSRYLDINAGVEYICTAITVNGSGVPSCTWTQVAGSGISSVSSLPATCTPGVTSPVQLSTFPFGIFYCSATNTWSAQAGTGSVNPVSFGAKFDGKACFGNVDTIVVTNASNQVTCNHANFTSTAVDGGKQFTASNGCCGVGANFTGTALFTQVGTHICKSTDSGSGGVGVVNSTTINLCKDSDGTAANAINSCSGSGCIIAWATNDDAAITAAEAAWQTAGKCGSMNMPAGITALLKAHFNNPGSSCLGMEPQADYTAEVDGEGIGVTVLGLFMGFDFTTCTGGSGGDVCFGGYLESVFQNLQWNGFGVGNTAAGSAKKILGPGLGSQWSQVACMAFGGSDANLTGFSFDGAGVRTWGGPIIDGCGKNGCTVNATIAKIYYGFCGDTLGPNLTIAGAADLSDYGSDYGVTGGTQLILLYGSYRGFATNFFGCSTVANATGFFMGNVATAQLYLSEANANCTSATSNGIFVQNASSRVVLSGGTRVGGTTAAINRSGGIVFTEPDTTWVAGAITSLAPTCAMTTGGGTSPSCALVAGSTNEKGTVRMTTGTGSPGTSGTTTMTMAGTYNGASGTTPACTFIPALTGAGVWNARATIMLSTRSSSAPVFTWDNNAVNLGTSTTWDVDYVCVAR